MTVEGFELIVDAGVSAEQTSTGAMLWTKGRDPHLVDVQLFTNAAELRSWLKEAAFKYGAENIGVRWTAQLLAFPAVAKLIAVCLDVEPPQPTATDALLTAR
jgi:hypothetical protein